MLANWVLGVAVTLAHQAGSESPSMAPANPLTVCEVLEQLVSLKDKVLAVRGELRRHYHGSYLVGPKCRKPLVTSGYVWPNPVGIVLAPPYSPLVENPSDKTKDVTIDPQAAELLKRYAADPEARIWATFVGRLETRREFPLVLLGDGNRVPYGYGHLNASPAQLVYYEIKEVVVQKTPTRKEQ